MPIGINHIESVNVYLVEDGDSVTLVDCGMWHPGEPDDGLATLRHALNTRGYVLEDISRIFITHAHIDHYGMAGRLMELTGAELLMHAMTDLDCEKYRHPDTAQARKRDTYSDHGVPPGRPARIRRHARRVDAVPALRRGGLHPPAGRGVHHHRRRDSGKSCTLPAIHSATSACGRRPTGSSSPGITFCPLSPRR